MKHDNPGPGPYEGNQPVSIEEATAEQAQFALPEYLVFLILGHIKNLRRIEPNHILVKAVEDALKKQPPDPAPQQNSFGF